MRKIFLIFILAIVLIGVMAISTSAVSGWTEKQDKAHEIAEIARSMGLPEDDPIIRRASEIWWEEQNAKPKLKLLGESYWITGYDDCASCCGVWAGGPTASGVMPTVNHTVAVSSDIPFGTRVYIEGLGYYTVEDRGVGRGCVDVFCNNHEECNRITGYYTVYLVEGE